ncbi:MAG: hypothetical protein ACI3VB_05100 [Oscillospiraceae bacterium]
MKITKEAVPEGRLKATEEAMRLINGYSKRELAAEEVFIFELRLCDNQVDRDHERFSAKALKGLAELFVGKTGIFDHQWTSSGQKARIFKTEVVEEPERAGINGERYAYLKASAYMLREGNGELISEIEGGIKREVSVGCSMGSAICSICGEERGSAKCGHSAGREYGGKLCYFTLDDPKDAYEWSFVAVPAQKEAGVMKKYSVKEKASTLEELVKLSGDNKIAAELEKLKTAAAMGDSYISGLRNEVVRLSAMARSGIDEGTIKSTADKMSEEELLSFKKAFERKIDAMLPVRTQLIGGAAPVKSSGEEFKI